jgi:hypothetical protein
MIRVVWKREHKIIAGNRFRTLADAKEHAERYFFMKQKESGIDRVEIRDQDGALCFRLPKRLSRNGRR